MTPYTTRRRYDWVAVDDDDYYWIGDPMGIGRIEAEAVEDLLQQLREREERREGLARARL